jgi:hypothetical protein
VGQFGFGWGDYFEHQIGTKSSGIITDSGANGFIGAVRNAGADAGTGLHSHLMALADQLLDGFGSRGNARLTGMGFERNTDVHFNSPA